MLFNRLLISIFFTLVMLFMQANYALAKTLVVDKSHGFSSIQEAINNAEEFDSILISSGEYNENLYIDINNIEIIGEDVKTTFLKSNQPNSGYGIRFGDGVKNIKIFNINISEYLYGIYSNEDKEITNITLNNLILSNNGNIEFPENCNSINPYTNCNNWNDEGGSIKLKNLNNSYITNLIISENEKGLLIYDSTIGNNFISNNQISNNQQYGIRLNNGGSNNIISDNIIYENSGEGIEIFRTDNNKDKSLTIIGNQLYQNKNDGIRLENQKDFAIEFNSFSNNAFTTNTPYSPGKDPIFGAIFLNSISNGEIKNNNFDSNGRFAIFIDSGVSNINIYNNLFEDQEEKPQVSDNGSLNNFYIDKIGNYWSDLEDNTEYTLTGTSGNKDIHPLSSTPQTNKNNGINLYIDEYQPSSILLSWNKVESKDLFSYQIQYTLEDTEETTIIDRYTSSSLKDSNTISYKLENLEANKKYFIEISAIDSNNNKIDQSDTISFTTMYNVEISTPKEIEVTSIKNGEVYLSWFPDKLHGATKYYEIFRSTSDDSNFEYIGKVIHPKNYLYDMNLNSKLTYNYKIRTINEDNISAFSGTVSIQPNTILELNDKNNINKFNSNDISSNTIVSHTNDDRSELLFSSDLAQTLTSGDLIINGIVTKSKNPYKIINKQYSFINNSLYYYSLSQVKNFISIATLPKEAILTIKYSNNDIAKKIESNLVIGYFDPVRESWMPLLSDVNPNSNTVSARINYLGIYKILYRTIPLNLSDVDTSDWVYGYINNLSRSQIINGYDDLTFRPTNSASRAEVLKMKIKAMGVKVPLRVFEDPCKDVLKDKWYAPYFQLALSTGLINGYSDGTCKPNQPITRIEALKVILGDISEDQTGVISFADSAQLSTWAVPYVKRANNYSIISGYADNTFRPNANILRQEIAKILYQYYRLN